MNNQYIQYPLKWSVKPPESISVFRALVGNTKRVLQCFGFAQIVPTLCDSRTQFFKILPAVWNSSLFSAKISIWIPWDVGVKIASDFKTSGLQNCLVKVAQIVTKRLSVRSVTEVRYRELWILCNTLVAWQRLHMVLFFAPKGTLSCFGSSISSLSSWNFVASKTCLCRWDVAC